MTSLSAGRGLRALPRRRLTTFAGIAVIGLAILAVVLMFQRAGGLPSSGTSGSSAAATAGTGATGGHIAGTVPGFPTEVGGVHLVAAKYAASEILDRPGGEVMRSLLTRLAVDSANVNVTVGVDMHERLSIGLWDVPGVDASRLRDAWVAVGGSDWRSETLGGESVLVGSEATSGAPAYVFTRDSRLVYIVTKEPSLAEAAVSALR